VNSAFVSSHVGNFYCLLYSTLGEDSFRLPVRQFFLVFSLYRLAAAPLRTMTLHLTVLALI